MFSEVICCPFWFGKVGFLGKSGLESKGVCGGGCWRFWRSRGFWTAGEGWRYSPKKTSFPLKGRNLLIY